MIRLSLAQYAEKLGVTRQSILYRINNNRALPGVKNTPEKVGNSYILEFDEKQILKKQKIFS